MRFPTGIRKIVELYGDQILTGIGGWVDWGNPLGCAHFGCVWEIWSQDPAYDQVPNLARPTGLVLKLSTDPTEGPVIAAIMKTGLDKELDGLTRWHGVWRIPERVSSRESRSTGWVIIREEVRPYNWISDVKISLMHNNQIWIDYLKDYNAAAYRAIHLKSPAKIHEAKTQMDRALRKLFKFPETYFVAQAIDALALEGILLADVHHENLGFRIHNAHDFEKVVWLDGVERPPLLIFDPGHSRAPVVDIPDLW